MDTAKTGQNGYSQTLCSMNTSFFSAFLKNQVLKIFKPFDLVIVHPFQKTTPKEVFQCLIYDSEKQKQ